MKLVTEESDKWKRWMRALAKISEDVTLGINQDGISQRSSNPPRTTLISCSFDKKSFEEYDLDQNRRIAVDIDKFSKMLRRSKSGDNLEFGLANKESELSITMKNGNSRRFTLPILVTSENEREEPGDLAYGVEVVMKVGELSEEIDNIDLITDSVLLRGTDSGLEIESSGGQGGYKSMMKEEDLEALKVQEESESVYKIRSLNNLLSPLDNGSNILVKFGSDTPAKIVSGDEHSRLEYMRAPVVKSQD